MEWLGECSLALIHRQLKKLSQLIQLQITAWFSAVQFRMSVWIKPIRLKSIRSIYLTTLVAFSSFICLFGQFSWMQSKWSLLVKGFLIKCACAFPRHFVENYLKTFLCYSDLLFPSNSPKEYCHFMDLELKHLNSLLSVPLEECLQKELE